MALTSINSIIMQCSAAGFVQTKPIIPRSAVLHIHQNESLSFDECLKIHIIILRWEYLSFCDYWSQMLHGESLQQNLCFICHYASLWLATHAPVCKKNFSNLWVFSPVEKLLCLTPPPHPSPMKHQSTATLKLQARFGIALLPPDPVITAHTTHQHYYSSNHSIIIPQNTSKSQLTFQGKNKNSWIMH